MRDLQLPDVRASCMRLNDLLAKGPRVLSFYRGGWCQYCNLELQALQRVLPEITGLGAELVAISPKLLIRVFRQPKSITRAQSLWRFLMLTIATA